MPSFFPMALGGWIFAGACQNGNDMRCGICASSWDQWHRGVQHELTSPCHSTGSSTKLVDGGYTPDWLIFWLAKPLASIWLQHLCVRLGWGVLKAELLRMPARQGHFTLGGG